MAKFDTKLFLELSGKGGGPVQALGAAFGMPSCLVNLGAAALSLLPSSVLKAIRSSSGNGAAAADSVVKAAFSKLRFLDGIIEYDTEDGAFRFVSDSSKSGIDKDEGSILGDIAGFAGALAGFAGRLYNNYQTTAAQINAIKDCIDGYRDYLKFSGGNAVDERMRLAGISPEKYRELVDQGFGIDKEEVFNAVEFRNKALELQRKIDEELARRVSNPSLEPEFIEDFAGILSGTNLNVATPTVIQEPEEVFRLSFGPPVAKSGKFILSVDGLYFDSQTSGIVPALLEIERNRQQLKTEELWSLNQDPNLGGRGKEITAEYLKYYINTILDPSILDDSDSIQNYYNQDVLLNTLIGQKNRKIFDVSGQISALENEGGSRVLIANLRQVMLSEASHFLSKINKRKKQIELAVKLPVLYGKGQIYAPGKVPINDFSYLEGTNFFLSVESQKTLVLNQEDVKGIILPLQVKYVEQLENTAPEVVIEHLLINTIGLGSIISESGASGAPVISVNQSITTDGLVAYYPLLTYQITDPSSTVKGLMNFSEFGQALNAQLVGIESEIFNEGVGIAYLHGVTKHSKTSPTVPSSIGSYIKLPPITELQDLVYNQNGGTFEAWVHAPQLDGEYYGFNDDYDVSGLYRLLLSNENVGAQLNVSSQANILRMVKDNGGNFVKGLIFGFTRDSRLTSDQDPSNESHDNRIEDACLVLAPTQSYDSSSIGFIRKTGLNNCDANNGWLSMKYPIWNTVNGVSLSACGREFCQITLTLNPIENEIKMYCDGELLTTSSYNNVFGQDSREALPDIPSLKKDNSFEYDLSGPQLDPYFTPWIVGGGYTDGMQTGNFMGGLYGGVISGLKGYVGGIKFYSKALSSQEVVNNYEASRSFFKNIDVPNLMWEPIISE